MQKVIQYKCDYCGKCFDSIEKCSIHEYRHESTYKANRMLKAGYTLSQINEECNIWRKVPEYLMNVTINHCFTISYWQCCSKPAYKIYGIDIEGNVNVRGCGSWSGYFGKWMPIYSNDLRHPHNPEELFIDPRYEEMYGRQYD